MNRYIKKGINLTLFIFMVSQLVMCDLKANSMIRDAFLISLKSVGLIGICGVIYELSVSGTETPLLRDIELVEQLIYLSDRDELSLPIYDEIVQQIKEVPPYQLTHIRHLLEFGSDQDPADYMTDMVIKNLYRRHNRIGLVARWRLRAYKRKEEFTRIIRVSRSTLQGWYCHAYRTLWGENNENNEALSS